jgi:hypothetical protein
MSQILKKSWIKNYIEKKDKREKNRFAQVIKVNLSINFTFKDKPR